MRYLGNVLGNTDITTSVSGLVISNVAVVCRFNWINTNYHNWISPTKVPFLL